MTWLFTRAASIKVFGNVEVASRGMDVVLARLVGVDVRLKVGERAEEPLGEGPLGTSGVPTLQKRAGTSRRRETR